MAKNRFVHLRLIRVEAESLMDVGNRGLADLQDFCNTSVDDDVITEDEVKCAVAENILEHLGRLMREAGWADPKDNSDAEA